MILDSVVIALIALSVFLGYKQGLIKLSIKFVALVISIVVTTVLYNPIANLVVNTTNIDETIEDSVYEKVIEKMSQDKTKSNYFGISNEQIQAGMITEPARELAINIVRLGVFLILLISLKVALRFINTLANAVSNLPIVSQFDKLGGSIYGLIRGLLVMFIILVIVEFVTETIPDNVAHQEIQKTQITKMMYENNILTYLFPNTKE